MARGELEMASWFHAAILATGIAATAAVGFASAAMLANVNTVAAKGDRLTAVVDASRYQTVETRSDGLSVLTRIQVD
jgi:hypothetical protein